MGTLFGLMYIFAYWQYILIAIIVVIAIVVIIYAVKRKKSRKSNSYNTVNPQIGQSFYTKVVGVTYNGIQNILPTLHAGMPLRFIREPNNQYDKSAIAVKCNFCMIGYLSADLAADIAPLMDSGARVEGEIAQITGGHGKTYGCNIEITIYK